MKKVIIVKKKRAHRIIVHSVTVFITAAVVAAWFGLVSQPHMMLLLLPAACPVIGMVLLSFYYETWKVVFAPDKISVKIPYFKMTTYSYSYIQDAYLADSYTEHEYICITFRNGKKIRFRTEDENARKAIARLESHRSVRINHNLYDK